MNAQVFQLTPLTWEQAWQAGSAEVGGKAAQLAALVRYGCPTPHGIVFTATQCKTLISADLWQSAMQASQAQDWHRLDEIRTQMLKRADDEKLIQALARILDQQAWQGTALAVRSSAPGEDSQLASFAGIHDTVLNVNGAQALAKALLQVVSSIWTSAASLYRQKIGMHDEDANMAVVVMPMIQAQCAGVIFTRHPRSGREDQFLISVVEGLADKLVDGSTDGEDIVVQRDWVGLDWQVKQRRPSSSQHGAHEGINSSNTSTLLNDAQAVTLAKLALDVAYAFDYSEPFLDIEWVFDGQQFHLVQARPITHRACHSYAPIREQGFIWTRGNTREILPYPVTVSETAVMQTAVNHMLSEPHRVVGHALLEGAQRIAFFHGHAYLNASLIQWEIYHGFGIAPELSNFIIGGHQSSVEVPTPTWRERAAMLLNMVKAGLFYNRARAKGLVEVAAIESSAKTWSREHLRHLADRDLLKDLLDRQANTYRHRSGMCMMQGASGSLVELRKQIIKALPEHLKTSADAITAGLMTEGDNSVSAQQAYDMLKLAKLAAQDSRAQVFLKTNDDSSHSSIEQLADSPFATAYRAFIERYGHRGNYESYVSRPSWREDPRELHQSLLALMQVDGQALRQRQLEQQAWARDIIKRHLSFGQRLAIRYLTKQAKQECNQRELARSSFARLLEQARHVLLELGERLVEHAYLNQAQDIFHLTVAEMQQCFHKQIEPSAARHRIDDRQRKIELWQQQTIPDVIHEGVMSSSSQGTTHAPSNTKINREEHHTADASWPGIAISMASYQGTVRKITHPNQIGRLNTGDIMLAPSTDPSWLGLFLKAGGVIVETGGYLSHSAIVARELGIPTIVNIPGIMEQINDGDVVRIDGEKAQLVRLKSVS